MPECPHVLCAKHLKDNARHILQNDAVIKQERDEIIYDIFGQDGLISADDIICYNDKCSTIEIKLRAISTTFRDHCTARLRPILKKKVCDPVREEVTKKNGRITTMTLSIPFSRKQST
ncbi:hypothetical protein DPMN_137097 [Dreissena polymorpha]|uniref:Uncharacterized protein n=1 Tax=Dreissena polymorpha TaxID=45954 RepID=A0A9D4G446_DREPO|nr:hypothetical protein DPMN_137097 [Dreissena polymorpha]